MTAHNYTHDLLHRRTRDDLDDGGHRSYGYNDRGEVVSAQRFLGGNAPLAGFQQSFGFDNIGNRVTSAQGGDENGANLAVTGYSADSLNQYGQITHPQSYRVTGKADSNAAVTVGSGVRR